MISSMTEAAYFPGQDYPDREVWLKIRYTPRNLHRGRILYAGKKPLVVGTNAAKRALGADRSELLKQRREYYHRIGEAHAA